MARAYSKMTMPRFIGLKERKLLFVFFVFLTLALPLPSLAATRKKLFEIARTFSEKTKRRKSKRKVLLKHHSYPFCQFEKLASVTFCYNAGIRQI